MRIVSFSVMKYRSIKSAQKLPVGDLTTLVGPNNEGKSNILRAMVLGMLALSRHGHVSGVAQHWHSRRYRQPPSGAYQWERDFPVSLQEQQPNGRTILDFEFLLDPNELQSFRDEIGSTLNGYLPIRVFLGRGQDPEFVVRKQGPGGGALTSKSEAIARFVGTRLRVEHVPSVRTAEAASEIVQEMVADQLARVEESRDYQESLQTIAALQAPVLAGLSDTVRDMLREFLPEVVSVSISLSTEERLAAFRRSVAIVLDDGSATDLFLKGDGVQSLAALSLIRHAASQQRADSELVLCVEEPEAHLHPRAVHQLREVLHEMAGSQQIVVTTHSPLLINRFDLQRNIIVRESRARPASSISELRDALGVRTPDNLRSALVALVVEGESDRVALSSLLAHRSSTLRDAMGSGVFAIETLTGGGNLLYRLSSLREAMCRYHVFLDNDYQGVERAEAAEREGLLGAQDRTFARAGGRKESELEDLISAELYADALLDRFNVNVRAGKFRQSTGKWSKRMGHAFQAAGQQWDRATENLVKTLVAEAVARDPGGALKPACEGVVAALVRGLESKLSPPGGSDRPGSSTLSSA